MSKTNSKVLPSELLRELDLLQKDYLNTKAEMATAMSRLRVEETRRLAAEEKANVEASEADRLRALRADDLQIAEKQVTIYAQHTSLAAKYEEDCRNWQSQKKELEASLAEKESQLSQLKKGHEDRVKALEQELSGAFSSIDCAEERIQSLRDELERGRDARNKSEHVMANEYEGQIRQLRERLQEKERSNGKLHAMVSELKANYATVKRKLDEHAHDSAMGRHAEMYKTRLVKMKKENEELQRRLRALEQRGGL